MVKPLKKKDKPQNDEKQTKISSFFGNQLNKKESKLFTKISTVQDAGRLTLTTVKKLESVSNASADLNIRETNKTRNQSTKKKLNGDVENTVNDVVLIDDEDLNMCPSVKINDTESIVAEGGKKSLPISDPGQFISVSNEVHGTNKAFEAFNETPKKQGKASTLNNLESSPDIICETPNADSVFTDASAGRKKAAVSRSFLCPKNLLGVQPGLKPAHLRINQKYGAKKVMGKVSVSFTMNSESGGKSSEDSLIKDSPASEMNKEAYFEVRRNATLNSGTSYNINLSKCGNVNPSICFESFQENQASLSHGTLFQEDKLKINKLLNDANDTTEKGRHDSVPETQYVDNIVNFQTEDNLLDDVDIDQVEKDLQRLKKTSMLSEHFGNQLSALNKKVTEQFINKNESRPTSTHFSKALTDSITHSLVQNSSPISSTTDEYIKNNVSKFPMKTNLLHRINSSNEYSMKTSSLQRTKSSNEFSKTNTVDETKSSSRLINALETVDSRAALTEDNLWIDQRLIKHFSEDDFNIGFSSSDKKQDPVTTPVKIYGNSKHIVKRQATSGLSPYAKRHPNNTFTDLKDKVLIQNFPAGTAKKALNLENLALSSSEMHPNKSRLTEDRAYKFGLKKKSALPDNKEVTLANDKLLSELMGQLKSPSKTATKSTIHALKEVNSTSGNFNKTHKREKSTLSKYSKENTELSKNMLYQKSNNENCVGQSDIEMLDQLFGNETSDSEDIEEFDRQQNTTHQDVYKKRESNHCIQGEPIIVLDDTLSMGHEDCIIIDDNSDICQNSTTFKPSNTRVNLEETISVLSSKEMCSKEACEMDCSDLSAKSRTVSGILNSNPTAANISEHPTNICVQEVLCVCGSSSSEHVKNEHSTTTSTCMENPTSHTSYGTINYSEKACQISEDSVSCVPITDSTNYSIKDQIDMVLPPGESVESNRVVVLSESKHGDQKGNIFTTNNVNCNEDISAACTTKDSANIAFDSLASSTASMVDAEKDTQLTASICEMMEDSFDDDLQDFKESHIPKNSFRFTELWKRFTVMDIVSNRDETHLQIVCDRTRNVHQCILRGFWIDTIIAEDDVVNIVGSCNDGVFVIDNNNGLIIVNPDQLLSSTLVVSSTFCARKSLLNEKFKGVDSGNLQMLHGSVIHSLFQTVLKDGIRDERGIMLVAKSLLKSSKFLHEMYSHNVDETSVIEEVSHYIPSLISWLSKHTLTSSSRSQVKGSNMIVTDIHDIEENIWSPSIDNVIKQQSSICRFGLKGKIDVTVKAKMQKSNGCEEVKIVPLELKTGKASFSHEHKGQVLLYSLMSSDRREELGEGILLYLKNGEMDIVPAKPQNVSGLIQLRNNLSYHMNQQVRQQESANGQFTYQLGQLPQPINHQRACTQCPQLLNCCIYQRMVEDVDHPEKHPMRSFVPESLKHLSEDDLSYFTHWMLCLDLEGQNSQKSHLSQIWRSSSSEREKSGECISNLVISSSELNIPESQCYFEGRGCSLTFIRDPSYHGQALNAVGLTNNDMVVISSEDGKYIALATGFVRRISNHLVEVVVDRDYLHDTSAYTNMRFRLDKNESFTTSGYLYTNLSRLMEATPRAEHLRDLITRLRPPQFELKLSKACIQKVKAVFKPLNQPQRTAILKVLMSKDYVLIKGFPGTGKTATVVALVKILSWLGQSVLLTSYTHSAVDNILLKLKEAGIPFLRLGRMGRIHPDILPHSAEVLTTSSAINSVQGLKHFYDSFNVVATSALGINHPIFKKKIFDICILDEASQVLQPACLGPLFQCHRFVLVGDPKQLPPLVQSKVARKLGMDESLFARLDDKGATYDLCLQYRMNRVIMGLSNFLVYDGKLQCGDLEVAEQFLTLNQDQIMDTPSWMKDALKSDLESSVMFLDTQRVSHVETSSGRVVTNESEADLIMYILRTLVKAGVRACDVGVISPYRSQVMLLQQKVLGCTDVKDIEVNTVDQYQGRDKRVILVSFVRSNCDNTGELLKDLRRLNVALTRAKHKLILIGNAKALKAYEHMAKILMHLERTNNVIEVSELSKEIK